MFVFENKIISKNFLMNYNSNNIIKKYTQFLDSRCFYFLPSYTNFFNEMFKKNKKFEFELIVCKGVKDLEENKND